MSDQHGYAAGSLRVFQRPDEIVATLTRLEFRIICDGDTSSIKTARDMFLGIFVSAVIGFIGIWVPTTQQKLVLPTAVQILFATMILVSIILAITLGMQMRKKKNSSAYSGLMQTIENHFEKQESANQPVPAKNPFQQREQLMGRYFTPEKLVKEMNDPKTENLAQFYLIGAYDLTQESGRSCAVLGTTTPKQLEQIYSDYLKAHPTLLKADCTAAGVAAQAFAEHWPPIS